MSGRRLTKQERKQRAQDRRRYREFEADRTRLVTEDDWSDEFKNDFSRNLKSNLSVR